jgi:hypothetical protein
VSLVLASAATPTFAVVRILAAVPLARTRLRPAVPLPKARLRYAVLFCSAASALCNALLSAARRHLPPLVGACSFIVSNGLRPCPSPGPPFCRHA